MSVSLRKANFWEKYSEETSFIKCLLCPKMCIIEDGKTGFCKVRKNIKGVLYSISYGHPVAVHVDPIEKKPLANFLPSSRTFSLGTYGCNFDCKFCQNYTLSKLVPQNYPEVNKFYAPEEIVLEAIKHSCESISFTYNEPTTWIEYAIDIAKEAKKQKLPLVLVSNGFISEKPRIAFYDLIDAANIDMKAFSEDFYSSLCTGNLKSVLDSIKYLFDSGKHLEITNLVIPSKNDDLEMIKGFLDWVEDNLSKDVPIHFSAFHPCYKLLNIQRTSRELLYNISNYAKSRQFSRIYLGNIII